MYAGGAGAPNKYTHAPTNRTADQDRMQSEDANELDDRYEMIRSTGRVI